MRIYSVKDSLIGFNVYTQWKVREKKVQKPLFLNKRYRTLKRYKVEECEKPDCEFQRCKYFHSQEERRFNIAMEILKNIDNSQKQGDNWHLKKGWLKVSEAIPHLTYFSNQETFELSHVILTLRDKLSEQGRKVIGISMNMIERRSFLNCRQLASFIGEMKSVNNLFIRTNLITYSTIFQRKAMTIALNSSDLIEVAISQIKLRRPNNLKIVVKEFGKDFTQLSQLFQNLASFSEMFYRFELDLSNWFPKSEEISIFYQILLQILTFTNLRVFKLKVFANEKSSSNYEIKTEVIDYVLLFLKELQDKSAFDMQIFFNICNLEVSKKRSCIEIKSDATKRKKKEQRTSLVRRLNEGKIHAYLIQKFQEDQLQRQVLSEITFDFSNFYALLASRMDLKKLNFSHFICEQAKLYSKYIEQINNLLTQVWLIMEKIADHSLIKFTLKFFQFHFSYFCDEKRKMGLFKLQAGMALHLQNRPVAQLEKFVGLGILINQKLNLKYQYRELDGNIFGDKELRTGREKRLKENKIQFQNANSIFMKDVIQDFRSISKVKCGRYDSSKLNTLIQETKIIVDAEITDLDAKLKTNSQLKSVRPYSIFMDFQYLGTPLELNQLLNLFRKRMLSVIKAIKKIQNDHPGFSLRQEQVLDILEIGKLGLSDLDRTICKWISLNNKKKLNNLPYSSYEKLNNIKVNYAKVQPKITWKSIIYESSLIKNLEKKQN